MIEFVNAKINIGLNIVGKRSDGYHLLKTVFYPVGINSGVPADPFPFCDMMELTKRRVGDAEGYEKGNIRFLFSGDTIDCLPEKNLIVKGVSRLMEYCGIGEMPEALTLRLEKHLPSGAGMGGGSADCVAAMKLVGRDLERIGVEVPDEKELCEIASKLGADCPVFVVNRPAYAEGIGERLEELPEILKGKWLVVVKPDIFISTAEAFSGVRVKKLEYSLRESIEMPIAAWRGKIVNDFEYSLFPKYPELEKLKNELYQSGAEYASLTGSGAALYGIYSDKGIAADALGMIEAPYKTLLSL